MATGFDRIPWMDSFEAITYVVRRRAQEKKGQGSRLKRAVVVNESDYETMPNSKTAIAARVIGGYLTSVAEVLMGLQIQVA